MFMEACSHLLTHHLNVGLHIQHDPRCDGLWWRWALGLPKQQVVVDPAKYPGGGVGGEM